MSCISKQAQVSQAKQVVFNLGLVFASIVACIVVVFICGEAILRFQFGSVPPGPNKSWIQHDSTIGWVLKPGSYSFFHVSAFRRVDLSVNELGLRNKPISVKAPASRTRVSVLGDSFVFGASQSDGETLTDQMQSLAGDGYEIINISAERYGTGQQIRLLERLEAKGYEMGSKLVLMFFPNDILDNLALNYGGLTNAPRQPKFRVDDTGRLTQIGPAPPDQDKKTEPTTYNKSLFYSYLLHNIETIATAYPSLTKALFAIGLAPSLPRRPGIIGAWYGIGWEERWANTREILTYFVHKMRKEKAGTEVYIAFLPSPFQVHEVFSHVVEAIQDQDPTFKEFLVDVNRPQRMLRKFCDSQGINFIDTTIALRAVPIAYLPRDGHLNQIGTDIVARLLLEKITTRE